MISGYVDFEFDLPEALLAHLIRILDGMESAPLAPGSLAEIPDAQGVYQLFLDNELVYIGKTDAEAGLRERLERHGLKIQHRVGLDPAQMTFKAVRVYVFTAVDLETQLIAHYRKAAKVNWNGSGFGSNDPGQERDTTEYKPKHFDWMFPIDIDRPLDITLTASDTAANVFTALKQAVPYTFRFQAAKKGSRRPHPDLEATTVSTGSAKLSARGIIEHVVRQLPPGWQATRLPSHVILYKTDKEYPQGNVIARST